MYYCDPTSYTSETELKTCPQCRGSGKFHGRGAVVNGKFTGSVGICYACNGKGKQNRADAYRNKAWIRHNLARLAR